MSVERGFLGPLKAALCCNSPLTRSVLQQVFAAKSVSS